MTARLRRSCLYMPASNQRAIEKARMLDCDVVILDLEDAVAPDEKERARQAALRAIADGGFGERELVVRINDLTTLWGPADLAAISAARPDAILLPKVEQASAVEIAATDVPLWVMVETPRAVLALEEIAGAGPAALVVGTNDLLKDMRAPIAKDRTPLHAALSMTVMAARAHGIAALDGVYNDFGDEAGLAAECAEGAAFGFDGKTLIHPAQIAAANAAFAPQPEEVAYARQVIAAFADPDNRGKGAIRVGGRMAERLHLGEAERLVGLADEIARRG